MSLQPLAAEPREHDVHHVTCASIPSERWGANWFHLLSKTGVGTPLHLP